MAAFQTNSDSSSNCNNSNSSNSSSNNTSETGAWIGIDLGTTNCAAAVWDSTRGRPKVLRLGPAAIPHGNKGGKDGRILPSIVLFRQTSNNNNNNNDNNKNNSTNCIPPHVEALVGQFVKQLEPQSQMERMENTTAIVTSVKRLLNYHSHKNNSIDNANTNDNNIIDNNNNIIDNNNDNEKLLQSMPMNITISETNQVLIHIQPLHSNKTIQVTPVQIIALILSEIKSQAEQYLTKNIKKKKMSIPGNSFIVSNAVIGIPAHFSSQQIQLIVDACRLAHFTGTIQTIIESTAASMAYGLFVSVATPKHVMVLDIGGGTTDVTISLLAPDQDLLVIGTLGNQQLGGDDMDLALFQLVMKKLSLGKISNEQKRHLLVSCQSAKEALCGTDNNPAISNVKIQWETISTILTQDDMNTAIAPWIQQCRELVMTAIQNTVQHPSNIEEVVLVGGATRVPAVRIMLHGIFPHIQELCTSLHAETAVAQGAAIQAAILSQDVSLSHLKSCMMLDALPHAIGAKVGDSTFIEILQKDMQLPAMGYATFELATAEQAGVTIVAVEHTGQGVLELMGEFTFLLKRLSKREMEELKDGKRTIDVGMTLETSGKFICSIFDKNDPEHLRKRQKYQRENKNVSPLEYSEVIKDDDGIPLSLILGCVILFLLYVSAKLAFHELDDTARIL